MQLASSGSESHREPSPIPIHIVQSTLHSALPPSFTGLSSGAALSAVTNTALQIS